MAEETIKHDDAGCEWLRRYRTLVIEIKDVLDAWEDAVRGEDQPELNRESTVMYELRDIIRD